MTTRKYEIVRDKVRVQANDPRQWFVYVDGKLRAVGTSRQQAEDFVVIEKDKETKAVRS